MTEDNLSSTPDLFAAFIQLGYLFGKRKVKQDVASDLASRLTNSENTV